MADTKGSALNAIASLATGDEFLAIDAPGGSPELKNVTIDVMMTYIEGTIDLTNVQAASGAVPLAAAAGSDITLTVSGAGATKLTGSGEILRIIDSSGTGNPEISLYQDTTQRARIVYPDVSDRLSLYSDGDLEFFPGNASRMRLNNNSGDSEVRVIGSAAGSPELTLYQDTALRAFVQYSDSIDAMIIDSDGPISLRPSNAESLQVDDDATATNTRLLIYDVDNGQMERVSVGASDSGGSGFKVLRIPN